MIKHARELVEEANAEIESLPATEAVGLAARDDVTLVELRDIRERIREGFVPGSLYAPRGMLEFWADPESSYYRGACPGRARIVRVRRPSSAQRRL